jgi:hypothetical protein
MTGLDWNAVAIGASATAIAALIVVTRRLRRRRRRQTIAGVHPLGERRIEVVAIDAKTTSKRDQDRRTERHR